MQIRSHPGGYDDIDSGHYPRELAECGRTFGVFRRTCGKCRQGKRVYVKYGCYECHGREAQGSPATGPRLGPDPFPYEAFSHYVRSPAGAMPPYTKKVVSDQDLADICAFLESLPHPPAANTIPLLK